MGSRSAPFSIQTGMRAVGRGGRESHTRVKSSGHQVCKSMDWQCSSDLALVVLTLKHERRLDHVCQCRHLHVAKHELEQREEPEDALCAAAEFGVNEPTICMASAHVGNELPLLDQKRSTSLVNLFTPAGGSKFCQNLLLLWLKIFTSKFA